MLFSGNFKQHFVFFVFNNDAFNFHDLILQIKVYLYLINLSHQVNLKWWLKVKNAWDLLFLRMNLQKNLDVEFHVQVICEL